MFNQYLQYWTAAVVNKSLHYYQMSVHLLSSAFTFAFYFSCSVCSCHLNFSALLCELLMHLFPNVSQEFSGYLMWFYVPLRCLKTFIFAPFLPCAFFSNSLIIKIFGRLCSSSAFLILPIVFLHLSTNTIFSIFPPLFLFLIIFFSSVVIPLIMFHLTKGTWKLAWPQPLFPASRRTHYVYLNISLTQSECWQTPTERWACNNLISPSISESLRNFFFYSIKRTHWYAFR